MQNLREKNMRKLSYLEFIETEIGYLSISTQESFHWVSIHSFKNDKIRWVSSLKSHYVSHTRERPNIFRLKNTR